MRRSDWHQFKKIEIDRTAPFLKLKRLQSVNFVSKLALTVRLERSALSGSHTVAVHTNLRHNRSSLSQVAPVE